MVGVRSSALEWMPHTSPTARPRHRDRCISPWLGSVRAEQYRGSVVRGGESSTHQPSGVGRGSICICEEPTQHPYSPENGQHFSDIVHQPHGRYQVSDLMSCCMRALAMVPRITISAEHLPGSRNVIADLESHTLRSSTEWMLEGAVFKSILNILGPLSVDLFASRLNNQLVRYASWRPDPFAVQTCHSNVVAGGDRVCFPSFCSD